MQSSSFLTKSVGITGILLCVGGCSFLNTPYQQPKVSLPASWQQQEQATATLSGCWWEQFQDSTLNTLISEALRDNSDLANAALLVRKARLQADLAQSDQLPGVAVDGTAGVSRNLGNWKEGESRSFSVSGALNYEVDLWGRLANTTKASQIEALATEADRAGVALSLIGTVASTYYELGYLNERVQLSLDSIAYAKRTLALVRVQKDAGATTSLEVLEAERSLASQEASHTTLVQQLVEARHTLALLFDGPPEALQIKEPQGLDQVTLPAVQAGLPITLLARRPDVQAAELRVRSALATTDATRASFYPTFSLTGSLGESSDELSHLLSNPIGALTAELALPFLEWRDMQRTIKISEVEYDQAVLTFRQTLYTALSEVENSLSARKQYRLQAEKLTLALDRARQTEALYYTRYKAGGSALKSWLDAQEDRRQAEISLAENRLNQLQNYITLCQALGGGQQSATSTQQPIPPTP